MRIGIIGYGKMGKMIETTCQKRNHTLALIVDNQPTKEELIEAKLDVAIEFTMPDVAYENLSLLAKVGIPTVSGTTGWLEKYKEVAQLFVQNGSAFIHGTNYSLGVNLFFALNQQLAKLMKNYTSQYNPKIEEIHHTQKLDAPSGTAITLAEGILSELPGKEKWILGEEKLNDEIGIIAKRIDPAPGTHLVTYHSEVDEIEIKHTAHSRKGFALGAVIAAEWIHNKKGVFTMKDVLGL
jgi:4-hydroxy-tetrahydrodipicolinate reductase